jgi:hypothetical protein
MKRLLLVAAVVLAACSSGSTGPGRGLDPTVLITNQAPDTLYFTWRDGQGITGAIAVPPSSASCTRFLAQADSAYFEAHTIRSTYTQPWFDPATHPAWTMELTTNTGYNILVTDVGPTEPC